MGGWGWGGWGGYFVQLVGPSGLCVITAANLQQSQPNFAHGYEVLPGGRLACAAVEQTASEWRTERPACLCLQVASLHGVTPSSADLIDHAHQWQWQHIHCRRLSFKNARHNLMYLLLACTDHLLAKT